MKTESEESSVIVPKTEATEDAFDELDSICQKLPVPLEKKVKPEEPKVDLLRNDTCTKAEDILPKLEEQKLVLSEIILKSEPIDDPLEGIDSIGESNSSHTQDFEWIKCNFQSEKGNDANLSRIEAEVNVEEDRDLDSVERTDFTCENVTVPASDNSKVEKSKSFSRKSYSYREKANILKELERKSVTFVSNEFNINEVTLRTWKRHRADIEQNCSHEKLLHAKKNRGTINPRLYDELYEWFVEARNSEVPVTRTTFRNKAIALNTELGGNKRFTASIGWIQHWKRIKEIQHLDFANEKTRPSKPKQRYKGLRSLMVVLYSSFTSVRNITCIFCWIIFHYDVIFNSFIPRPFYSAVAYSFLQVIIFSFYHFDSILGPTWISFLKNIRNTNCISENVFIIE